MDLDAASPLTAIFVRYVPGVPPPGLEALLHALFQKGAEAHPSVALGAEPFVIHLAQHKVRGGEAFVLEALCVEDLFLTCACAAGNVRALADLERTLVTKVPPYISRVSSAPDFVADVLQTLRVKLLLPRAERPPGIGDYAGRAPLAAWLRVAAVRIARDLIKEDARYVTLPTDAGGSAPSAKGGGPGDPEQGFLKAEGTVELDRAFARTLEGLDDRDRTLLRLYFVEGMSLAALGRIYHLHESTMMRRIHTLRERLLEELKKELGVDSVALASKVELVASRLDIHLGRHLRKPS